MNAQRILLRFAGSAAFFLAMATSAAAEDCKTMLKPSFDWIQQTSQSTIFPVRLTFTAHTATSAADFVDSGFGDSGWNGKVLTSQTSVYSNQNPSGPVAFAKQLSYLVKISSTGWVSIQKRIDGKAFLGRPPVEFQGVCSKGLITGTVNSSSYSFSLRKQPSFPNM